MLIVGVTCVVNTLSEQVARHWQATELMQMIWRNAPVPPELSSPQAAMDTAPGVKVESIAMPGTPFAGGRHYSVLLSGDPPQTTWQCPRRYHRVCYLAVKGVFGR